VVAVRRYLPIVLLALACARQMGSQAAAGAAEELRERAKPRAEPGELPIETTAGVVVGAILNHLQKPENLAKLQVIVKSASGEAADEVHDKLVQDLVRDLGGEGELGRMISATASQAANSAADGALRRLLPDCEANDARCLDRRVEELSHRAGSGLMRGLRESVKMVALLIAFLMGALVATLIGVLVRLRPISRGEAAPGRAIPSPEH
jgi:hypothetical protein